MTLRVLLADDHPVFLDGLRLLLETAKFEVVGAATNGAELLEQAQRTPADVAVVDLDMPVLGGIDATRELARRHPTLAVLVLTMHDDDESVRRVLQAGAQGYVLKGAPHGTLVRAVHAVAAGDTVLADGVGRGVLANPPVASPGALPGLTTREAEVLALVAQGKGNAAIAGELHLSLKTVQNHVSNLMGKLGVDSRAAAVARARDAGVGHLR